MHKGQRRLSSRERSSYPCVRNWCPIAASDALPMGVMCLSVGRNNARWCNSKPMRCGAECVGPATIVCSAATSAPSMSILRYVGASWPTNSASSEGHVRTSFVAVALPCGGAAPTSPTLFSPRHTGWSVPHPDRSRHHTVVTHAVEHENTAVRPHKYVAFKVPFVAATKRYDNTWSACCELLEPTRILAAVAPVSGVAATKFVRKRRRTLHYRTQRIGPCMSLAASTLTLNDRCVREAFLQFSTASAWQWAAGSRCTPQGVGHDLGQWQTHRVFAGAARTSGFFTLLTVLL